VDPDFWLERWSRNEIGFHLPMVNPLLPKFWPRLELARGSRVLVPLAGKTLDAHWLIARGHPVVAVELSEAAALAFYDEAGLQPECGTVGPFLHFRAGLVEYLVGDFFELEPGMLGKVGGVWDRGAFVALPPPMRGRYAGHLAVLAAPGGRTLLATLEYDQQRMKGPPFAVPETEVRASFGGTHAIQLLEREDILDLEPRFRERGLNDLLSCVYMLTREP
jgi:thiopurine S-methyltransferase